MGSAAKGGFVTSRRHQSSGDFENLHVYLLAEKLADDIWKAVSDWDGFAKATVGRQIVRAADSVGANPDFSPRGDAFWGAAGRAGL